MSSIGRLRHHWDMSKNWDGIDDLIVETRIIPALTEIRERFDAALREAIDVFNDRYGVLRGERPNDFVLPHGEYGLNVYT